MVFETTEKSTQGLIFRHMSTAMESTYAFRLTEKATHSSAPFFCSLAVLRTKAFGYDKRQGARAVRSISREVLPTYEP